MTREDIIDIIHDNIVEHFVDVERADLEFADSFDEFGANSLDMLEVVSVTMRQIDIKVPRSELADVETIDGLADKFMTYL